MIAKLRTYTGLRSMESKLDRLLTTFKFSTMSAVYGVNTRTVTPVAATAAI